MSFSHVLAHDFDAHLSGWVKLKDGATVWSFLIPSWINGVKLGRSEINEHIKQQLVFKENALTISTIGELILRTFKFQRFSPTLTDLPNLT